MVLLILVSEWGRNNMRAEEYKLSKEKFVLVNENKKLRDKELVTKPIGFFRDAMNRFAKNKGSIFGAIVIGILVLFALVVPIVSPYTVSYHDSYFKYALPKLFDNEKVDFLDGAKNKKGNLNTLIYFYSMGAETGHNAIKRQEYKADGSGLYSYRLDSYRSSGTVFMNLEKNQYDDIQHYQDQTGIQIIYPITNPDLRPEAPQDNNNANYWYKTKLDGSITAPDEYTIKEDGTIELQNIYLEYSTPIMECLSDNINPARLTFTAKDAGYVVEMKKFVAGDSKKGTKDGYENLGYLSIVPTGNENSTFFVEDINDASVITYDFTKNTFVFEVEGHDDAAYDGEYIFGVSAVQGSKILVIPISEYDLENYIPFSIANLDKEAVTAIDENAEYLMTANRQKEVKTDYFLGSFLAGFSSSTSGSSATAATLKASGTGFAFQFKSGKFTKYLTVSEESGAIKFTAANSATASSIFYFDSVNQSLYTEVGGKDLYFAINFADKSNPTIEMKQLSEIDGVNIQLLVANTKSGSTFTPATAAAEDDIFYFIYSEVTYTDRHYYANGRFKGDNYFSKMRVEGEDTYKYSYAIQKDGDMLEVRVNYYEYYHYYHSYAKKDGISYPLFIFGATAYGQDIFVCLASGARFSFMFAIIVAIVNMVVGAIYGAIEGYYGGKVDILMERIVEILSAVPFMIVITLMKYHMDNVPEAFILFIAFFATGWIGMSGTVRMQFYRFKNQEYVLASRTLGAKDLRIMFKHIFPNSLGTIVTSSVLVIPSMIFSETSLSYLGIINLSSGNMTSVGTLLAAGQPYLITYPHMILFPAIFISLLMLCFNLFGNGLRDAFNPSLRGTED